MSDFQYLAMHSGPDGKQTSMYDKVLMLKPEKEEFFNRELPLYIPPPIFSRLDTPVDYFYRPDTQHRLVPFLLINSPCWFLKGKKYETFCWIDIHLKQTGFKVQVSFFITQDASNAF